MIKYCVECSTPFQTSNKRRLVCSDECRLNRGRRQSREKQRQYKLGKVKERVHRKVTTPVCNICGKPVTGEGWHTFHYDCVVNDALADLEQSVTGKKSFAMRRAESTYNIGVFDLLDMREENKMKFGSRIDCVCGFVDRKHNSAQFIADGWTMENNIPLCPECSDPDSDFWELSLGQATKMFDRWLDRREKTIRKAHPRYYIDKK